MEERGIGVGITTSSGVSVDNFDNDQEISLAGINNKGYILTTVLHVLFDFDRPHLLQDFLIFVL